MRIRINIVIGTLQLHLPFKNKVKESMFSSVPIYKKRSEKPNQPYNTRNKFYILIKSQLLYGDMFLNMTKQSNTLYTLPHIIMHINVGLHDTVFSQALHVLYKYSFLQLFKYTGHGGYICLIYK